MNNTKKYIAIGVVAVAFIAYLIWNSSNSTPTVTTTTNPAPVVDTTGTSSSTTGTSTGSGTVAGAAYKDGSYTGPVTNAYYGNIQVKAVIQGGILVDVQTLQSPHDQGTSVQINQNALPTLRQEAIASQGTQVNVVSGATQSSEAYQQSLAAALAMAKN